MACDVTVLKVSAPDQTSIEVSGTIGAQTCPELSVTLSLPAGPRTIDAQIAGGAWTATFRDVPGNELKTWCETASAVDPVELAITVICSDNGVELCRSSAKQTLQCCPWLSLHGPTIGDCITNDEGSFRDYAWTVDVVRPDGFIDPIQVELRIWRAGETPNGPADLVRTFSDGEDPDPIRLRAGRSYVGRVSLISEASCSNRDISIVQFPVPLCQCDTAPLPDDFFTLTDPQGVVVTDPDDTGCVRGDAVTITAASAPSNWRVTVGDEDVAFERIDDKSILVPLPADGARVLITATVTEGDCFSTVSVSAKRCAEEPCVAVPGDYKLIVVDSEGNAVANGDCVPGTVADITAPDHEGPVVWTVDNNPTTSTTGTDRRILVDLTDDNEHTVSATVGRGACAMVITRTLKRCSQKFPKLPWCMLLMFIALCCFFVGHLVFAVGSAILLLWPCLIFFSSIGGTYVAIGLLVAYVMVAFATAIGMVVWVIGTILLFVWLFVCRACRGGLKSPYSFCQMLQLCWFILTFGSVAAVIIDAAIYFLSALGGAACGVSVAGPAGVLVIVLQACAWLLDVFGLLIPNLVVSYIGNAIGCFNTWPIRFIPIIRFNLPSFLDVRCPDELTPSGD